MQVVHIYPELRNTTMEWNYSAIFRVTSASSFPVSSQLVTPETRQAEHIFVVFAFPLRTKTTPDQSHSRSLPAYDAYCCVASFVASLVS